MVKTDATGLHAEDCGCLRCETGFRPTPGERAAARRALAEVERLKEARAARESGRAVPELGRARRALPSYVVPPPPTPEQAAELAELRERFRRGGA